MAITVRPLTGADAPAFQALRLQALQFHPEAYGSSYEEEVSTPIEKIADNLDANHPNSMYFGAFDAAELIGIARISRYYQVKTRHRAMITMMYVDSEKRGHGAGQRLMDALIAHARTLPDLVAVTLAVTVGNDAARRLYIRSGFVPFSLEPQYIRTGGRLYDIEWMHLPMA